MSRQKETGARELARVRRESRPLFWAAGLFSVFVNLLMLTGPLYMLQVYDRVLGSRSVETLLALTLIMGFFFLVMGLLDFARGRVLARIGARFQSRLDERVFNAMLRQSAAAGRRATPSMALSDLESVQRFLASPALSALFDLPWTPIFLFGIFLFHPWLGALAVAGGVVLIAITVANQAMTRGPLSQSVTANRKSERMADDIGGNAEMVQGLGMRGATFARWQKTRDESLGAQIGAADLSGGFSTATRTLRLFLQSAMLGLGALLVLRGEATPGVMIAASVLLGRALAPVDTVVGQWQVVQRAIRGWSQLSELLGAVPPPAPRTDLPRPAAKLELRDAAITAPGVRTPLLRGVSFTLSPGQAMGVIGPSGAGKSTLARALTGIWPVIAGQVRLDGATLDQYDPDRLGAYIGYLPQAVQPFAGTVAENIARMAENPDSARVVEAARAAGAHEMILRLPEGYDTQISAESARLSGGEMQRIGLARALYGDPAILILDEPNANLDNEGSLALNAATEGVKARGGAVIVIAHRPSAIRGCDTLLMLEDGRQRIFGPREKVLAAVTSNHEKISQIGPTNMGGVS